MIEFSTTTPPGKKNTLSLTDFIRRCLRKRREQKQLHQYNKLVEIVEYLDGVENFRLLNKYRIQSFGETIGLIDIETINRFINTHNFESYKLLAPTETDHAELTLLLHKIKSKHPSVIAAPSPNPQPKQGRTRFGGCLSA
jgi:hypothetical protein